MNEDLERKIKEMTYEELVSSNQGAGILMSLVSLLGIGTWILLLSFSNIIVGSICAVLLIILGNVAVIMSNIKKYTRERLQTFKK